MEKVLVVVSGGMDSVTMLHDTVKEFGNQNVSVLSMFYGSKHNEFEIPLAKTNCDRLKVPHTVIDISFINQHFKSDLLSSGGKIPEGKYDGDNMKSTVVPFRNGIILSIAAGFAESNGADILRIGTHSGDHHIYPDCRPEFNKAIFEAIKFGTEKGIRVQTPYQDMNKTSIVERGLGLGVDYHYTHTCYNPTNKQGAPFSCGKCGSCVERLEAFHNNGIPDPINYVDREYYKKVLNIK